jgi:hypothetical protein
MALSDAERAKRYRDRKRGGPPAPRELRPHGTPAAFRRHERSGEDPCDPCKAAEAERQHLLYLSRLAETSEAS